MAEDQKLGDSVSDASLSYGHSEDTIGYISDLMLATEHGRIPILTPDTGELVGLIVRQDILRLCRHARTAETERQPFLLRRASSI